jgi:hypothetical protein
VGCSAGRPSTHRAHRAAPDLCVPTCASPYQRVPAGTDDSPSTHRAHRKIDNPVTARLFPGKPVGLQRDHAIFLDAAPAYSNRPPRHVPSPQTPAAPDRACCTGGCEYGRSAFSDGPAAECADRGM